MMIRLALLLIVLLPQSASAQPSVATGLSGNPARGLNFSWVAVSGATWYYLWVTDTSGVPRHQVWYTASQLNCGAAQTSLCQANVAAYLLPGTATWWVQTYSESGGYGAWTTAQSFNVSSPLFTVVDGTTATQVRGNATAIIRLGGGNYEVVFGRDVTDCSYVATLGSTSDGAETPGIVTAQRRGGNPNGLYVATTAVGSGFSNRNFHLSVRCH